MTRRKPRNRTQRSLDRPARERYATRTLSFDSDGTTCRGTLYLPASADDPPVIVMGPEVGADRTFGLPAVAERFASAGYAVFLFDYRGFGDSEGRDQRIAPAKHRRDYESAIGRVKRVDTLGSELVLYGIGLSAAHAITVAQDRRDVDAVVAITPVLDGRTLLRRRDTKAFLRALRAGVTDAIVGRFLGDHTVPIVGDADALAVIADPGAKRSYLDLVDRDSAWRNETTARSLLALARSRGPERIDEIRAPTLVLAGTQDLQAPIDAVEPVADRLPRGTYVRMPADHWSVYGIDLDPAIGHQLSFLTDVFDG